MQNLEAILIAAGIVWGSYSVIAKAFQLLNDKRDKILFDKNFELEHRKLMFYSDFIPMQAGVVVFLASLTFLLTQIPYFVENNSPSGKDIFYITYTLSVLPGLSVIGYAVGGYQDISLIMKKLDLKKNPSSEIQQNGTKSAFSNFRKYVSRMNAIIIFLAYIAIALMFVIGLLLYRTGIINL